MFKRGFQFIFKTANTIFFLFLGSDDTIQVAELGPAHRGVNDSDTAKSLQDEPKLATIYEAQTRASSLSSSQRKKSKSRQRRKKS
jgi:hypothetical protein